MQGWVNHIQYSTVKMCKVGWIIYSKVQFKYLRMGGKYTVKNSTNVQRWVDNIQYSTVQICDDGWILYSTVQSKYARMGG